MGERRTSDPFDAAQSLRDPADWRGHHEGPVVLVRTFKTDPGYLDAFLLVFQRELRRVEGRIPGWRGSRVHRSLSGSGAVSYAVFDSQTAYEDWTRSTQYRAIMDMIDPFIEDCSSCLYAPPGDGSCFLDDGPDRRPGSYAA